MNVHFIAIGGSIMHSLAIALQDAGHEVTGSDDKIYDPAKSRLTAVDLLPSEMGWNPDRIHENLDAIILGMHAFEDNPELHRARELNIPIYSFPEFIYERAKNKQRIVIAGSFGKTTVTSIIMHVMKNLDRDFDYLVGAQLDGFSNNVRISESAQFIILEGDEYLSSKIDPRPKFLLYQPHAVVINGISWDHINVFPTEEIYVEQFKNLVKSLDKAADIIYPKEDKDVSRIVEANSTDGHYLWPFSLPKYKVDGGVYQIKLDGKYQELMLRGKHNMANIAAAWEVCKLLSVGIDEFLTHVATFEGAKLRMEDVLEKDGQKIIKDFAHAPIKVKATTEAVSESYPKHNLIACVELHTFSSLNRDFLPLYKNVLKKADHKIVYISEASFTSRRMEPLTESEIKNAFGDKNLIYTNSQEELVQYVHKAQTGKDVMLMMSSGNFSKLEWERLLSTL